MNIRATEVPLADKVRALRDPASYPHSCAQVEAIETHFSWIFLVGEFAYKMKKPVQIERMDFRELAERERNCREELRLNRRLAPQAYLDVVGLDMSDAGLLRIDGGSATVEWLVKMRRLPAPYMLDRAIAEHTATARTIQPAATMLADFFRRQRPVLLSGVDYVARLHARVDETREQLLAGDLALDPTTIENAIARQRTFLVAHNSMLQTRATNGKIIEGHGDLRPEHVFLGDESAHLAPCVIDCLEFDRDLRILDPLEELAFLALECKRLDAAWVGAEFVDVYRQIALDDFDPVLLRFYRSQRALNRAKIAGWHLRDPQVRNLADWRVLAKSYIHNALQAA